MKVTCVLVMFFFAFGSCQFEDFGKSLQDGIDSIGKTIQEGYDELVNQLEKVPFIQDVKDFSDFVVSILLCGAIKCIYIFNIFVSS